MQDHECNISTQRKTTLPSLTLLNLEKILELLLNTQDINVLTRIFSIIGIYTLSPATYYDNIIKCEPLYDKIALVVNSGLQAKTIVALNLICALLYVNERGQTRKKSLRTYAQNMIRISGCLTAMTNLFASYMLHQDTLKALCRGISEACRDSTSSQTCCSHLIPLCIQRCRAESSDMFIVLQSLLSSHHRNVKLFYESNGMTIFIRKSLQHLFCLQLLNTVVENTTNDNQDILLKSSHLFKRLQYLLNTCGVSSSIGQWVSIILFSYRKVLNRNDKVNNICVNGIKEKPPTHYSRNIVSNTRLNDTNELFRNILNEVIELQNKPYKSNKNTRQIDNNSINFSKERRISAFDTIDEEKGILKENIAYKRINEILNKSVITTANDNLSFSFLLKYQPPQYKLRDQRCQTLGDDSNPSIKSHSNNNSILSSYNQTTNVGKTSIATLTQEENKDSSFCFAPPFVSTPKKSKKILRSDSVSSFSQSFLKSVSKSKCDIKTKVNKNIKRMSRNRKIQNKTIGAKFFDIINGSCTTIVKSFTSFKNIFRPKEPSLCKDDSINTSCRDKNKLPLLSTSFANYMRNRDANSYYFNKQKDDTLLNNECGTEEDNFRACNTCDDTIALKQKLIQDPTLQRTIKRLKFGINLYGCDFKKISRSMWPNEHYMTPSILYNLYRKLIIK